MKALLGALIAFSLFTGCAPKIVEVPVFVEAYCPKIIVINKVAKIDINETIDGSLTDKSISNLLGGARQLRKTEKYYIEQVSNYNAKFTKSTVDK